MELSFEGVFEHEDAPSDKPDGCGLPPASACGGGKGVSSLQQPNGDVGTVEAEFGQSESAEVRKLEGLGVSQEGGRDGASRGGSVAPPPQQSGVPPISSLGIKPRAQPSDFILLKVVGKGAFGKVLQVRHAVTKKIYAMKVMDKKYLSKRGGYVAMAQMEKEIMTRLNHPFIVSLRYAFQTPAKLFLVSDFCAGGELFHHLGRQGMVMEDAARIYIAEIILAIEYLHAHGIIHRDLKVCTPHGGWCWRVCEAR